MIELVFKAGFFYFKCTNELDFRLPVKIAVHKGMTSMMIPTSMVAPQIHSISRFLYREICQIQVVH